MEIIVKMNPAQSCADIKQIISLFETKFK